MHAVLGCWIPITHHYALPILPTTSQGNTPNISSGKRHFVDTLITAVKTQKRLITRNTNQIYFKIGDQAILRMKTIQYAKFGPSSRGNLYTNLPTPQFKNYDRNLWRRRSCHGTENKKLYPKVYSQLHTSCSRRRKFAIYLFESWGRGPVISYRSFIKLTTKSASPVKDEWEIEEILANR
jgi:hypothetical protein